VRSLECQEVPGLSVDLLEEKELYMKTTIKLLSWTQNPIETIYCEWMGSRQADWNMTPQQVREQRIPSSHDSDAETDEKRQLAQDVHKIFEQVVDMKIPVSETIHFVFQADHVPIALREQWVRHRVVHKFGNQIGADIIPDIHESTWWSQTMRVLNMGEFASKEEYLVPESLKGKTFTENGMDFDVEIMYKHIMSSLQRDYNRLIEAGVPVEDARNILPLATQHRITWSTNLSSLMHLLSKRGCWIAQLGMWEPIVTGIVKELSEKIDPYFRRLIDPPCIGSDGEFEECRFKLENENRIKGEDPYPPCSLYLWNDFRDAENPEIVLKGDQEQPYKVMKEKYTQLWRRDPHTGKRVQYA